MDLGSYGSGDRSHVGVHHVSAPRVLIAGAVLSQPMGGVRRHNAELLPRLAKLLRSEGGSLAILVGRSGLGITLSSDVEVFTSRVPYQPAPLRALHEGRALKAACKQAHTGGTPFDLVHTGHLPTPGGLPCPFTLTLHDLRKLDPLQTSLPRRQVAHWIVKRALKTSRHLITVSDATASELKSRWPEVSSKLSVIPNGGDHLPILPRNPGPGAPLLHVGHLERRKNLEVVVRALAEDEQLPDLHLIGASKKGEAERLSGLARTLGLSDRVHILGPRPDEELPSLLSTCAALVLPSRLEGFGISALEAQRARVPLAISSIPALQATAGLTTPRFNPTDPTDCTRAIRRALNSTQLDLENAQERAGQFTWDRAANEYLQAWKAAVAPRRP